MAANSFHLREPTISFSWNKPSALFIVSQWLQKKPPNDLELHFHFSWRFKIKF